jgi:hypothetical protein
VAPAGNQPANRENKPQPKLPRHFPTLPKKFGCEKYGIVSVQAY